MLGGFAVLYNIKEQIRIIEGKSFRIAFFYLSVVIGLENLCLVLPPGVNLSVINISVMEFYLFVRPLREVFFSLFYERFSKLCINKPRMNAGNCRCKSVRLESLKI